jgi:hypothetical protein
MIEVGTALAVELPAGKNERLLVRLMVRPCPVGTVITTGDQPTAAGFDLAQVAVEPATGVAAQL